jgi:hypothetical protein
MHTSFITILALSLSLICLGCLDPPGGGGTGVISDNTESSNTESSNTESGNAESNDPSLSLSEFLNSVSQSLCDYDLKCDQLTIEQTVEECVDFYKTLYDDWRASDCGPDMESYYADHADTLATCPDDTTAQTCNSDDSGICTKLAPMFETCD